MLIAGTEAVVLYFTFCPLIEEIEICNESGFSNFKAIPATTFLASELLEKKSKVRSKMSVEDI